MRTLLSPPIILLFVLLLRTGYGQEPETVKGRWFTQVDKALAAAKTAQQPVLAVAMDHG